METGYIIRKKIFTSSVKAFIINCALFFLIFSATAQTSGQTVTRQEKEKIMKQIGELFRDNYVFPDLGKKYEQDIQYMMKTDAYDSIEDAKEFAERITSDLQEITNDKHNYFRLIESSDMGEEKAGSLHHPVRLFRLIQEENWGFTRLDWLEGKIGYMDIRRFNPPSIGKDIIVTAMNFVKAANAIIIDIRENQGGDTDILPFFSSYFFEYPIQLNSDYFRKYDMTKESWTVKEIVGKRLSDIPLFILTSKRTFSAAESFVYDMKVRDRATIVGDSTRGGAHSVDLFKIDDRFEIYISTARSFNPLTGDNWEGTGVVPDILVPAESALDTALVLAKKAADEYGKMKDSQMKEAVIKMQDQLDRADKCFQIGKDDLAASMLDSAFQTGLNVNLIDQFFMQVLAYDYWLRPDDKMLIGILKKNVDLFPNSYSAYEILAWAYISHEKNELAAEAFKKVLDLNPGNSMASQMLEKLKNK